MKLSGINNIFKSIGLFFIICLMAIVVNYIAWKPFFENIEILLEEGYAADAAYEPNTSYAGYFGNVCQDARAEEVIYE